MFRQWTDVDHQYMNFDRTNKWLTLLANIGVLAGIVFLSLEINQSNRIAEQDARSHLTAEVVNIQQIILENQDVARLMSKLAVGVELTPQEEVVATSIAWKFVNQAAAVNLTYENEFISESLLQRYFVTQTAQINQVPGIVPYLAKVMASLGITRGVSPAYDNLMDAVDRYR